MEKQVALSVLQEWPAAAIARLKQHGITTVEQLMSKLSVPSVRSAIMGEMNRELNIPPAEWERLIDRAKARLSPEKVAETQARANVTTMSLGALPIDPSPEDGPKR